MGAYLPAYLPTHLPTYLLMYMGGELYFDPVKFDRDMLLSELSDAPVELDIIIY